MTSQDTLAAQFDEHRGHLRAVATRMLGSTAEADDAVQESWIRLTRADTDAIVTLRGWLTTVVARVCLDVLRRRDVRPETPMEYHFPDTLLVDLDDAANPESEALLAESVGSAIHVLLATLSPSERVAFVLHDVFTVPFDQIASVLDRTPAATKQLASRARARIAAASSPVGDLREQQRVVDAFFAAARGGDLEALVRLLHPTVEMRTDGGTVLSALSGVVRGGPTVAGRAAMFARPDAVIRHVLIDGAAAVTVTVDGVVISLMAFTVRGGRIAAIDGLVDPPRLAGLGLAMTDGEEPPLHGAAQ